LYHCSRPSRQNPCKSGVSNLSRLTEDRVLFVAILVVVLVVLWFVIKIVADALAAAPPSAASVGADAPPHLGRAAPTQDPELERARRYSRRLERVVHRLATRAERHERTIKLPRRATRHALGTSPIGGHWIERAFLCIHEHEGSWRAATGNGYYGGLQRDLDFQRAYGREFLSHYGTANHWPMSVQLAVAIRAWLSRGFGPWPNTRRMCGL
jgi:Transglycosylase-like domain